MPGKAKPLQVPSIIVHLLFFVLTALLVTGLALYQATNRSPYSFNLDRLKQSLSDQQTGPTEETCNPPQLHAPQLPSALSSAQIIQTAASEHIYLAQKSDTWSLIDYDPNTHHQSILKNDIVYQPDQLTKAYEPLKEFIAYPECTHNSCSIHFLQITSGKEQQIPAVYDQEHMPVADLFNFFFDEKNQIVSYTTNPEPGSNRVILDWHGDIIHQIDESPGINRTLIFKYYLPQIDSLVYYDPVAHLTDFFKANGISLSRRVCPMGQQ